ncbi:MAG: PEP-CTERM sorting domain-containing protein [Planctomycetales bacterium]|nr:PEP-CTERM sorting domain-containing protein [Planctomycetales bacterium]
MKKLRLFARVPAALAAAMLAGALAIPAHAVDFQWNVAGPADWNVGANWNPEGPPSGGGGNHAFINNGGVAEISGDIGDIQDIFVGAGVDTSGTLNQTGGNTFQGTGSWSFVGQDGGTGTYNLSGGSANKERLYIGRGNGGVGVLNLFGEGNVSGTELVIGDGNGSHGTATIYGNGNVTNNLFIVGAGGTGEANITDNGRVTANSEVWIANAGGTATMSMDSGSVEANEWIAIGRDSGTGTVNLSGTARLAKLPGVNQGFITLGGLGTGGGGTLNISENAVVESSTGMVLAETSGRYGIVNQSGGTVTLHDYDNLDFGKALEVDHAGEGLGEYHLSGGLLDAETIDATTGLFAMTGGVLHADAFEGNLVQGGGSLSPGHSPGTMLITGNYSLSSGDLFMELDGLTAGTEYDQLIVTGDVSLAGDLTLDVGFAPSLGDSFTIIDNQGANAIGGIFTQGSAISAGGYDFAINYMGGDGNDVVLTVVPEPTSLLLVGLSILGLFAIRRR